MISCFFLTEIWLSTGGCGLEKWTEPKLNTNVSLVLLLFVNQPTNVHLGLDCTSRLTQVPKLIYSILSPK